MSFAAKTDYLGLARNGLILRANSQNASNSILEIPGADGSILGDVITGHIKSPNCDYAISGTVNLNDIVLGAVLSAPYAVSHIHVTTGAGAEPTFTADGVQIENGASQTVCTYQPDAITLTTARHALTFGAFTYTETSALTLQSSEFDATADISPATVNNEPVASDATGGRQTVSITMWSNTDQTAPAVTFNTGWHVTSDWTCTGSDGAMFTWTCTVTKYLTADQD